MSRLSGAKGHRDRVERFSNSPITRIKIASLRWAHRRSGQREFRLMETLHETKPLSLIDGLCPDRPRSALGKVLVLAISLAGFPGMAALAPSPASATSFGSSYATDSRSLPFTLVAEQRWFQGGTLHRSTLREWLRASRRNQIATAADLSVHFLGEPTVIQLGMDAWRLYATSLVTCINAAAAPPVMDRPVIETAAACSIMLEQ